MFQGCCLKPEPKCLCPQHVTLMLISQAQNWSESSRTLQVLLQPTPPTPPPPSRLEAQSGRRTPPVTDVLLLDASVVSRRGRTRLPSTPGRLNFNKSGRNSFHTCGAKQGEFGGGGGGGGGWRGSLCEPQPNGDIICSGFGECEPAA